MGSNRRKSDRAKNLTGSYLSGAFDDDRRLSGERFSDRSKHAQQRKIEKTAAMRVEGLAADLETLPIGRVVQVFSLYAEVLYHERRYLCVVKKTLTKVSDTSIVVGDLVRVRLTAMGASAGFTELSRIESPLEAALAARLANLVPASVGTNAREPEGVIEAILPRETILTRSDSFKAIVQHPIVANAEQMLIVAAVKNPPVKWGLIDRMVIAAQAGSLNPILVLNKVDLTTDAELAEARAVLSHYQSLGIAVLETSAETRIGLEALIACMKGRVTVLAGHSGVGKSTLIRSIQPGLDIKIAEISYIHDKGKHTTTSAREYPLDFGGRVIDTPGVKLFGLWNITADNLIGYFPDVANETAPEWRKGSYERILESLGSRKQ